MSVLRFDPFRDPFRDLDRVTNQLLSGTRLPGTMPMDVWRSGQEFHVALDLPGVQAGSVEITVERGTLTVRAERMQSVADDAQVLVAERPQGEFTRQLMLGEGVDQERIQADYRDGVLHLTVPVAQAAQPRRISVTGGDSSGGGGGVVRGETVRSDTSPTEAGGFAGSGSTQGGGGTMS